ncbi:rod shape-determining protein RodA [Gracilinema caldarium]|uniref:Peptidoglycan glycosyltransferase RodA n=1 Tax=Gracilinema caldarium (strain ATCC 51460 / DSM 7334 / H1) TaxID=744872 RepID=F8F3F5_GRAC1|nr:rod shape-determining protein RodA [Gracilinema caldarium]AEJ19531.1 rod shape-determining protein RodA [Gracilinema caldarium DSM 7334]
MNYKRLTEIDVSLLLSTLILTLFGILMIYSSGVNSSGILISNEYIKQIIFSIIGLVLIAFLIMYDYRRLYDYAEYFYVFFLLLVLYTIFFGKLVNGARAWIGFGNFGIQPSEFLKIATIIILSKYLENSHRSEEHLKRFVVASIIVGMPMLFILLQPDLGTALVFIPIFLATCFIAGITRRYIVYTILLIGLVGFFTILPLWQLYILKGALPFLKMFQNIKIVSILELAMLLISGIAWYGYKRYRKDYFYWIVYFLSLFIIALLVSFAAHKVLKDYQIMRLIVFLDPYIDPKGSGWNIIQSITAIGSGGVLGKGYLQGTQSHYRFLPQQSTDFIFSIFSEEMGFIGGLLLFALFLLIVLRLLNIMKTTSDLFGAYIVAGFSGMLVFHFLINVGMTMGIMPITGIPLLFLSYGGSSLLSAFIGIGIALSIYVRRFEH